MHIPEGMLSVPVSAVAGVGSASVVAYALSWVRRNLEPRRVVLMAVLGALIFALQMLNFPISGGTSGHFAGGALAGIVLGPWPAALVMSAVLAIQAFVFADGGVIALGANALNMAIVAPFVGALTFRLLTRRRTSPAALTTAAFVAAWLAAFAASFVVVIELALSGTANFALAAVAMQATHAVIGIGEGLITAAFVGYLRAVRPDLLDPRTTSGARVSMRGVVVTLGAVALVAAGLSFLASTHPDGLEWVYFDQGIGNAAAVESARTPLGIGSGGPLAGYGLAGVSDAPLSSALAGVIGIVLVGGLLALLALRRSRRTRTPVTPEER